MSVITDSLFGRWSLRAKEAAAGYFFIFPFLIGFLWFTAIPMGVALYISFTDVHHWERMRGRLDVLGGKGLNLLGMLQDVAELATVRLQLLLREGDAGELGNLGDIDLDGHGRDGNQPDRHPRVTGTGAFPSHALAAGNVVNRMGGQAGRSERPSRPL